MLTHGRGPHPPMMSTMSGQRGKLNPPVSTAGGSPSINRQKLGTSRGTRQRGQPIDDNGPPLPPRNKK